MNKTEYIAAVAEKSGLSKADSAKFVAASQDVLAEQMQNGETISFVGFGTYGVKARAARTGKNPRTGETVEIAAAKVPFFKPGKALKDSVNK